MMHTHSLSLSHTHTKPHMNMQTVLCHNNLSYIKKETYTNTHTRTNPFTSSLLPFLPHCPSRSLSYAPHSRPFSCSLLRSLSRELSLSRSLDGSLSPNHSLPLACTLSVCPSLSLPFFLSLPLFTRIYVCAYISACLFVHTHIHI